LVPNTNNWIYIALKLEIDITEIERIKIDKETEALRFTAVLDKWQRRGNPPFIWNTMVQVLSCATVQEHRLAETIRSKYLL